MSTRKKVLKSENDDTSLKSKLDLSVKVKDDFALNQVNSMLKTYFDKKINDKGEEVLTPKLIKMEIERELLVPSSENDHQTVVKSFVSTFNLPLITLSPFNFMTIESLTINENSEVSFQTGITINPKGYETLINAYTQTISPVSIPNSD